MKKKDKHKKKKKKETMGNEKANLILSKSYKENIIENFKRNKDNDKESDT